MDCQATPIFDVAEANSSFANCLILLYQSDIENQFK